MSQFSLLFLGLFVASVVGGGEMKTLSPSQTIGNTFFVGLCMHGDLILSPPQQPNASVQGLGVSVYARQSDNSYVLQQQLGDDIMVADCAISTSQIVLTTFTQSTEVSAKVYSLYFFDLASQPSAAGVRQWKQGQNIVQTWESTGGIVATTIDMNDEYLALTSQYPNPTNTGTVTVFRRASSGLWTQSQQLTGKIDIFAPFPVLTGSLHGDRLLVTALPGVASNSTAAINIYRATGGEFAFESEVERECTWAVLGAGDTLATATKYGVDLYKLGADGLATLVDSLSQPALAEELRGTKSLKMSSDGALLVRGLGPYNYDSRTGCAVYSLAGQKVSQLLDTFADAPLTMACVAGAGSFGVALWDSLDVYTV